jgi:hypothetical protein
MKAKIILGICVCLLIVGCTTSESLSTEELLTAATDEYGNTLKPELVLPPENETGCDIRQPDCEGYDYGRTKTD